MTILLIGSTGQVGHELGTALAPFDLLLTPGRAELSLEDPDSIRRFLRLHRPKLVVNAAGYTDVDRAEEEPALAMAVNATGPGVLAGELKESGGLLIHYSTDYVFDGEKPSPYGEDDVPRPLNAYGRSKAAGEEALRSSGAHHLILRTSWVYGVRGRNFLRTILARARKGERLRVVDDQIGAPTWCRDIAAATAEILRQSGAARSPSALGRREGLYHLTAAGSASWYGFAKAILELDPEKGARDIVAVPSSAYPAAARRPRNSRLDCSAIKKAFGIELPRWQDSLAAIAGEGFGTPDPGTAH